MFLTVFLWFSHEQLHFSDFFGAFPAMCVFEEKLDQVHAWILSSILGQHNCPRWAPPLGPGGKMGGSRKTMGISPISCIKIGYLRVPKGTKHVKPDFLMAKVSGMLCRFRTGVWLSKLEMLQYHMGWKQKRNLQRARFSLWWLVLQFWLT